MEGRGTRRDEDLIVAVAGRDREALEELYRRHSPWIVARLDNRCADAALVEEAVQDTFVAVWKSANRYRGDGTVAGWLWGIAIRRLIGALRRTPDPRRHLRSPAAADVMMSAEEQVLSGVEHGDLAGALDGLAPELRVVLQATVLDGLTMREAARLLGIPTGTVKTRLSRARRELREALA